MNLININKKPSDTTVIVAMSGGVDSSTVAAMLKEEGYNVVGITMNLYESNNDKNVCSTNTNYKTCCSTRDIYDAKRVAEQLDIAHYVVDYKTNFKEEVIDYFIQSYKDGETPVPCIKCNQTVKFRDLINVAKNLQANALVTGHYIRKIEKDGAIELHKAVDDKKDQSYFLFSITKEQLDFTYFPLGNFYKTQIRGFAKKFGISVAEKQESQDICFVGKSKYWDIIDKYSSTNTPTNGEIKFSDGTIVGNHTGIEKFTIGQRKGLYISYNEPLYVIDINSKTNEVFVGKKSELKKLTFNVRVTNWLCDSNISSDGYEEYENYDNITVKIRSTSIPSKATISFLNKKNRDAKEYCEVKLLEENVQAICPGQACVFYNDSKIIGGGWIIRDI